MSEPRSEQARARAPRGLRWIAVLVALVFGCTTVRAPASAIGDTVPVTDGRPEPQLELWIESARKISPAESARAAAEARAALASAVAARQASDGDALLVVRAQGVVRTGSRKTSQGAAVAGLVVGAVVIVVVALVMLVSGEGHGSGGKSSAKAPARAPRIRAAPARGAAAGAAAAVAAGRPSAGPRAGGVPFAAPLRASPGPRAPLAPAPRLARTIRPSPGPWLAPGPVGPVYPLYPGPYVGGSYVGFDFWWGFSLDLTPYPYAYAEEPWDASWEAFPPDAGAPWPPPAWPPPAPDGEGERAAASGDVTTVALAPPPELRVGDRDFFDGDETVLELVWVDRHTGAPLRAKTVRSGVDPRDARAVGKLLDRALGDGSGWEPFVEATDGAPAEGE